MSAPRIDSHQHFWKYTDEEFSWIEDEKLRKDFAADDLRPILKENGVHGTIAVQARCCEEENEFLLDMADKHPDVVKGVVGWVDLTKPNCSEKLKKWSNNPKLVGIRHIVQSEPDDKFLLREDFCNGIKQLKEYNLKYDILIFNKHLKTAIEFVKLFPDQPFVLDHIAKPDINHHVLSPWADGIKELSRFDNVYVKVSGMVTEAKSDASYDDFVPYLDVIFKCFDINRIMIGSDWPVCTAINDYRNVTDIVKKYIRKYKEQDQDKVLGLNAINFYGIQL